MNINVVGTSGSDKSTLARRLAYRLGLPWIELDCPYWRPNWQSTPDEAFFVAIAAATASPGQVLDDNYNRSRSVKWREMGLVIWVDYSLRRTLCQVVWQTASQAWRYQELWPGTGNRESFRRSFCSRESTILWTLKTWRQNRRRYLADMQDPQYRHIRFVRVHSPRQAKTLFRELEAQRPGGHI